MTTISIDVRMLYSSGIGTYLQSLVPNIIKKCPDIYFNLLGNMDELKKFSEFCNHNVTIIDCRSPIYSLSEQTELLKKIPKATTLFWAPHYNIPIGYAGKLLVTIHDLFHLAMPQYIGGLHKRYYAKFLFTILLRKAMAIICVSDFTKKELYRLTKYDKDNVYVVRNGISDAWFRVIKEKKPHPKPYLLYVGNVKPHKNLGRLIQAFKLIKDKIPHDLIIIGKKEGFITGDKKVFQLISDITGRVYFTGYLAKPDLEQYYAHADVLVFVSLYEGFGFPPLEAMASGCPALVSEAASLPEVCGDAALYCDPLNPQNIAEKIILLLNDNALRDKLRKKGIEQASQFTWDNCADKTMDVIKNLLNGV